MSSTIVPANTPEQNRFVSISDFKDCIHRGGEVEFVWNGKHYGIFGKLQRTPSSPIQILVSQLLVENYEDTEKWCDTPDEALDYMVGNDRLRDVITKVTVLDRTI